MKPEAVDPSLPLGLYVCRLAELRGRSCRRCHLFLAVAHGPHAGKLAAVTYRGSESWLPPTLTEKAHSLARNSDYEDRNNVLLHELDKIGLEDALRAVAPTFVQLVRVALTPTHRCNPRPRRKGYIINTRSSGGLEAQGHLLTRQALGADRLLSYEETLAAYRGHAANQLADIFGTGGAS